MYIKFNFLCLQVLLREHNPGIHYEYWTPNSINKGLNPDNTSTIYRIVPLESSDSKTEKPLSTSEKTTSKSSSNKKTNSDSYNVVVPPISPPYTQSNSKKKSPSKSKSTKKSKVNASKNKSKSKNQNLAKFWNSRKLNYPSNERKYNSVKIFDDKKDKTKQSKRKRKKYQKTNKSKKIRKDKTNKKLSKTKNTFETKTTRKDKSYKLKSKHQLPSHCAGCIRTKKAKEKFCKSDFGE